MKQLIIKALQSSGKILIDYFNIGIKTIQKNDQSNVVTKADLESERNIVNFIKNKFPSHNIIAEETGFTDNQSTYTWIIDPLDGTANFVSLLPWFGILIAVLKDWQPIMAGIFLPVDNKIYFSEKNKGSSCNKKQIKVTSESQLKNALVSYSLDYSDIPGKTAKEAQLIKLLVEKIRNLRSTNSCFDFCAVAEGHMGAYLNQTAKIWDIAAPYLLIKEAGGEFTDIVGHKINFQSRKTDYQRNFSSLSAAITLYPQIRNLVKKVF